MCSQRFQSGLHQVSAGHVITPAALSTEKARVVNDVGCWHYLEVSATFLQQCTPPTIVAQSRIQCVLQTVFASLDNTNGAFPAVQMPPQIITEPPPDWRFMFIFGGLHRSRQQNWHPSGPSRFQFFSSVKTMLFHSVFASSIEYAHLTRSSIWRFVIHGDETLVS